MKAEEIVDKRIFDILFSMAAVLLFGLPAVMIAVTLKYAERGSVIFRQERLGLNKEPFQIIKFRTMIDNRPTRIGRILRNAGLDELPQFFNVLKGDMSIVGPRALTRADVKRLGWDDEHHAKRWNLRPGITGYAQLYGGQHRRTSWFWDRKYIEHNNMLIDFCAVVVSFFMNVLGKRRVRNIIWRGRSLK